MSGALIDLVAKGPQDAYITGDPQVSFFRQQYKRHSNFSQKTHNLNYIGTFEGNNEVTIPIPSLGDLLSYIWIEGTGVGNINGDQGIYSNEDSSVTEIALYIGGQQIVRLDSLYINAIHNSLYNDNHAKASCVNLTNELTYNGQGYASGFHHYRIPFFFCDDWTKSIPLVALQYHAVELKIKLRSGFVNSGRQFNVYANYLYLDTAEREFFVNNTHELLINQIQYQPVDTTTAGQNNVSIDLTYFNHPCKAVHLASSCTGLPLYWSSQYNFKESTLYINGTPLFEDVSNTYTHNIVAEMHTGYLPPITYNNCGVHTWPFSLCLSKNQPTGTMNFSRLDTAKLVLKETTATSLNLVRVYGVNYNVLRIKQGMAGVAFSN